MREKRRLKLARQRLTLANLARREAMAGLADAVAEEDRTASLARRSRELFEEYARSRDDIDAAGLRDQAAFVRALRGVARQAEDALQDASDQAKWQARTLAAAEARASRSQEQVDDARRELEALLERREHTLPSGMARKLQK